MAARSAGEIDFTITGDTTLLAAKLRTELAAAMNGVRLKQSGFGPLDNEIKRALNSANSLKTAIPGIGTNLQQLPVAAVQGLTVALTAATTAALGLGTAIATIGLKSASTLADTRLAIGALGDQLKDISAEQAVESLRSLSVQSGIALGVLSKFEQGFVSLGVSGQKSLDLIEVTLSALAATGNLTQASLNGVGRALQQIGSKPLLQLEELNQIADQIPAASRVKIIQQIAKDTGDSIAEVQERFRLGTQQSGDALTAVIQVIKDLDKSGQALENRTRTIGGAFAKMKAEIQNSLADVFSPLGDQLAAEMNKIDVAGLAQQIGGPIASALENIVPPLIAALPDIIEGLAFLFEKLAPLIGQAAIFAGNMARAFVEHKDEINSALSDLGDFLSGIISTVEALSPAFEPALTAIGFVIKELGVLGRALEFLAPAFEVIGNTLSVIFSPFSLAINLVLLQIEGLLKAVALIPSKIPILGGISDQAQDAANAVADLRAQLGSIDGSVSTAYIRVVQTDDMGAQASANALKDPNFLRSLAPAAPRIVIPNTGAGAVGDAAAKKAKAEAERLAKALMTSMDKIFKDLNKYAKDTGGQTLTTIQSNFTRVVEDMRDAIKKAAEAGDSSVQAALRKQLERFKKGNAQLVALAKRRDAVIEQLDAAKDALKNLRDESEGFMKSIQDSVKTFGNITQDTGGIRSTFLGMRRVLRNAITDTRAFTSALDSLRNMNLNETSLRQLIESFQSSPETGLQQARALARAGGGAVAEINQLQGYLESAGLDLATGLNNEFYTAGIHAAEGLVAGLQSQQAALVAAMDKLADALVTSIKNRLKIASPSGVFEDEIGAMMPEGAARGIYKRMKVAEQASAKMGQALVQNFNMGGVQVHGVGDPYAAERAGTSAGEALNDVLARRRSEAALAGFGGV